jgi:predicted PurR-regulated permease PerM
VTEKVAGSRLGVTLVGMMALVLFVVVASRVTNIIFLFFISVLLSIYLAGITEWIHKASHLPRGGSLVVSVGFTLLLLAGVVAVILPPVLIQTQELIGNSPAYLGRLDLILQRLAANYPFLETTLAGSDGAGIIAEVLSDGESFLRKSLGPVLSVGGMVAVELASVMAMAVYLALDPSSYKQGAISLFPPKHRGLARTIFDDLANTMKAWIGAQLLAMVVLAAFTALGLWLLRVPYFLAFGVFTGVAAIVPFFGTVTSTLLPALFVLATGTWVHSLLVVLLGVVIHMVEANVVAPLIFAQHIKVPPVLTIISVLAMAALLGVLGLMVAVPLLAGTLVIVRHVLMGEIYGDRSSDSSPAAVLVPTAEVRALSIMSRDGAL